MFRLALFLRIAPLIAGSSNVGNASGPYPEVSKDVDFVQGGTLKLGWKDCSDKTYHAKVEKLAPDTIQLGQKTSVTGSGTTDEQVTGGGFTIDAKFGPVSEHWNGDVCTAKTFNLPLGLGKVTWDGVKCPAAAGPVSVGVDVQLSAIIPSSAASGTISIKATDANKGNLLCLDLDVSKAVSETIVEHVEPVGDGGQACNYCTSHWHCTDCAAFLCNPQAAPSCCHQGTCGDMCEACYSSCCSGNTTMIV